MSTVKIPTNEDIKSGFTFPAFSHTVGEPSYNTIKTLETQAIRNAATVEYRIPQPHTNLCGLMEQPEVYVLRVGQAFPFYPYPGDVQLYPTPCTEAQKAQIDLMYNLTLRFNLICERLDTITKNMIENAVDNEFLAGIHTDEHGFSICTTKNVFAWLYRTYGKLTSTQITQNIADLNQPVDATKPIRTIFRQIENCQKEAIASGATFTDEQILKAAERLLVATGLYNIKYRD